MVLLEKESSASPSELASPQNGPQTSASFSTDQTSPLTKRDTPPAPGLNARSCITCRKRKVKCDKRHPCSNCNRAAIECIFPNPGRAPRRSRKPPDTELLARLRRLEGVVQSLGKGIDEEVETITETEPEPARKFVQHVGKGSCSGEQTCNHTQEEKARRIGMIGAFEPGKKNDEAATNDMVKEFGRLVVEEGRSRYVSNKFWTSLSEEVAEMQDILDDPTDDENENYPSPESGSLASADHGGFIFSFSSTILDLRQFHPPPEQISCYWSIFKTNVDPVMKLLHVPNTENTISQAVLDLDHVNKPTEALLFSIYFAAVTSMPADDCMVIFGLEKQATLRKYRFAVEQAFARADFLSTQELVVLQAFVLFLTCVRRQDDTRYVWTLSGLLIRLATSLGVHRDGAQFNLSPFETELRRRLWWQISTLDVRASEDHGCDPSIPESSFDTKFPLNINDSDIDPYMKEAPVEHEGATEMTFDLIRYSVSTTVRRLSYAPPGPGPCRVKNSRLSLEDKERIIEELHQYLENRYLRYCDTANVPLHWVAATVARLIMAKMWLVIHHPFSRSDAGAGLPQETRDRLFHTSIEVIEFSRLLETEKTTLKWGWLFRTYVQWHALAFVLSQLCVRTTGTDVDRAWVVIDAVFDEWGGILSGNQRGMLWKPLRKLMVKARSERAKALQQLARFPLDGSIGPAIGLDTQPELGTTGPAADFGSFGINTSSDAMATLGGAYPSIPAGSANANPAGLQQPPFVSMDQTQAKSEQAANNGVNNINNVDGKLNTGDLWTPDPGIFAQNPPIPMMLEDMNWSGWDDMVKDFNIEDETGNGFIGET